MLPITIQQASWPGNYPLNFSTPVDTTGVTGAVIFYSGTAVPGFVPNVSVGGQAAVYLGRISGANTTGTIYAWKILNPPQGAATPVRVWMDNQYGDPMRMTFVGFDTATDFGFFAYGNVPSANSQTPLELTGVTEKSGGCILALGAGHYNTISLKPSSPAGSVSLLNDATLNDHNIIVSKLDYTGLGQSITMRYGADYNTINGVAIEVAGSSGPPKQTLNIPGIDSTAAVGSHLVKDPNKALLGPASIVNTETALGAPVITRTIVAYYDLNGVGNTVSGIPGTTVERTSEASNYRNSRGSIPVVSGEKKYWEIHVDAIAPTSIPAIGIGLATTPLDTQLGGWQSDAISWDASGGARDNNTGMNGRPVYKAGDILMVAVDMTQGWVFMGMNGQWYNGTQAGNVNFSSGDGRVNNSAKAIANPLHPFIQTQNIGDKLTTNFGKGGAFAYAPPAGFTALDAGGPAKKTLNAPSIDTTAALGSHTLSNLMLVLMPTGLLNTSAMGVHSVIQLASTSGLVNTSYVGTPNVVYRLTTAGLLNTSSLGSPALSQLLKPASIANTSVLGAPSLVQTLNAPGIASTPLLGDPAVKASYSLAVPGILNSPALGAPAVAQVMAVPGLENTSSVSTPAVTQIIAVASYVNTSVLGGFALNQGIKGGGYANAEELGSPTIQAGKVTVNPVGINSDNALGNPALHYVVALNGIPSSEGLGAIFVTHIYEDAGVYPPSIVNGSEFGTAKIISKIEMTGILADQSVLGSPLVAGVLKLTVPSIVNAEDFGTGKLKLQIKPAAIQNDSALGDPTAVARLQVSALVNTSQLGTHSIISNIKLGVAGIPAGSIVGEPTIRYAVIDLAAPGIGASSETGQPVIGQIVKPLGILNAGQIGVPTITFGALMAPSIINVNSLGNHEVNMLIGDITQFTKVDGEWVPVKALMVRYENVWQEVGAILEKKDGAWVQIY